MRNGRSKEQRHGCHVRKKQYGFSKETTELHGQAQRELDRCRKNSEQIPKELADLLKIGYRIDAPWCILTFRLEKLVEACTKAKLANLATSMVSGCNVYATQSLLEELQHCSVADVAECMLSDEELFDILGNIFSSILSVLGGTEPAWWQEVLPETSFDTYWSVEFLQFQFAVAFRNMNLDEEHHDPSMFYFTRQNVSLGQQHLRVVDRVRMEMPAGLAWYLHHILQDGCGQNLPTHALSFSVERIEPGKSLQLILDPAMFEARFTVYQTSALLHEFVRHGVCDKSLSMAGGKLAPMTVRLQSVSELPPGQASGVVNCNILRSYFQHYASTDCSTVMHEGASLLGATRESIQMYIDLLTSALSLNARYRQSQLDRFLVETYLTDGMPYKKLTDGANTYLAKRRK